MEAKDDKTFGGCWPIARIQHPRVRRPLSGKQTLGASPTDYRFRPTAASRRSAAQHRKGILFVPKEECLRVSKTSLREWLELVAAASVVIGLILVAMELRQANNLAEGDAISSLNQQVMDTISLNVTDRELAELLAKLAEGESEAADLTIGQKRQVASYLGLWVSLGEVAWKYFEKDIISEEQYQDYIDGVCGNLTSIHIPGRWDALEEYYSEQYRADVEESCPALAEI
jgi:hypothetical protein